MSSRFTTMSSQGDRSEEVPIRSSSDSLTGGNTLPDDQTMLRLANWLIENRPVVVALSGGVDSAVMASLAVEHLGSDAVAVTGISPSLSTQELEAARRSASITGIRHLEVETDELSRPDYRANSGDRCYHCKSELYDVILSVEELAGHTIVDGAQASDNSTDRPGMTASGERGVKSPLRLFGIDKNHVREIARHRGLPSWNRPARPCLASRVPVGTEVSSDLLGRIEALEALLSGEGFSIYRARCDDHRVVVEIDRGQLEDCRDDRWRVRLDALAKALGFTERWLDLRGYGGAGPLHFERLVG